MRAAYSFVLFCLLTLSLPARALDAEVVRKLATGESDEQVAAVAALVAEGDAQASALLQALADGQLQTVWQAGADRQRRARHRRDDRAKKSTRCPPNAKT